MAQPDIFIDGEHGTTGLQIRERLAARDDVRLISIPHAERRNQTLREQMINQADIAILCLPDDASREAVQMLDASGSNRTRVIDASTAYRCHTDWVYGFAELEPGNRQRIAKARLVTNPGCYSTGAVALLRPLVLADLLGADYPLTINAVSGYSGGGKQMIAQIEDHCRDDHIAYPYFTYALTLQHKHVPEIVARAGLTREPVFTPSVGRFAQGMLVNVPLHLDLMPHASMASIHQCLSDHYRGQDVVTVAPLAAIGGGTRLTPEEMVGTDRMKLYVCGTDGEGRANLIASLDNLGKGASGAAVQNMDIMLRG